MCMKADQGETLGVCLWGSGQDNRIKKNNLLSDSITKGEDSLTLP